MFKTSVKKEWISCLEFNVPTEDDGKISTKRSFFGSEALASLFWCSKNRNVEETFNGAEAPFPILPLII